MIYSSYLTDLNFNDLKRVFFLSFLTISITACTTTTEKKVSNIDPARVSKIRLEFDNSREALHRSLPTAEIASRVAANLVHVGYPISTAQGEKYSHDLLIEIGNIRDSSTPVGFSFSAGDSDPRGGDFQKASVLPLSCTLTSRSPEQNRAEFTMDYASKKFTRYGIQSDEKKKLNAVLVDDMSTTCFNLLNRLKVKTKKRKSKGKLKGMSLIPAAKRKQPVSPDSAPVPAPVPVPTVTPESETVDTPTPASKTEYQTPENAAPVTQSIESLAPNATTVSPSPVSTQPDSSYAKPSPAQSSTVQSDSKQTDSEQLSSEQQSAEQQNSASPEPDTKTQTTEIEEPESTEESGWMPSIIIINDASGEAVNGEESDGDSSRKKVYIHNEGSPVILDMGYERK